jgi:adenine-specific DNA-methyltransferase
MIMYSRHEALRRIEELVSLFQKNEKRYLSSSYSEAQARIDFIDKFWIALGWDVNHEIQTDPYKQEVKVERQVNINGRGKRADYAFLAQNYRDVRFYAEAKKPNTQLDNKNDYFQTIRYGWNSHTPLAVLTDFEQFRLLDCRYKPDIDSILNRCVKKYHYTEYAEPERFDEIYHLLSHEAVGNSSLELFAESLAKPLGKALQGALFPSGRYQSIDESFLEELDEYRASLAIAFKRKNPDLDSNELTEIVQRTLDRLVFMRFLEDKLIEPEPMIESLGSKGSVWQDFVTVSHRLDSIYNGIIFKKHGLLDTPNFQIDERAFGDVRDWLAQANSPYDFNAIPIHILGSIYERFLGKTIITTEKGITVDAKPEVRKAGGVFYTPDNIVRYIVENTVGKLIEGKSPEEIEQMRFADISCGSGSFLLCVFDLLLRYHTAYYNRSKKNRAKGLKARCTQREDGTLQLSLWQKRRILLNNIYGVDVDPQAVEVAQLSLYLKLLDEETPASTRDYQLELRHALLPSLSKNIVSGNSLLDLDILDNNLFEQSEERKLNPMNFRAIFPEIMQRGGFDAIVGNPPYISVQSGFIGEKAYKYLQKRFTTMQGISDYFCLFAEQSTQLLRENGCWGLIIPSTVLGNLSFTKLRKLLLENTTIHQINHLGDGVFANAIVPTCIIITSNQKPNGNAVKLYSGSRNPYESSSKREVQQSSFLSSKDYVFNFQANEAAHQLLSKVSPVSVNLGQLLDIKEGIKTGDDKVFLSQQPFETNSYPLIKGRDIERYATNPVLFINYDIARLSRPQKPEHFCVKEKLVIRRVGSSLIAAYDDRQLFCVHTLYTARKRDSVDLSLKYILGIINSKLIAYVYQLTSVKKGSVFPEVRIYSLNQLPIRSINCSEPAEKSKHDRMEQLVEQLLESKQNLVASHTDRDKNYYENKIRALDCEIDQLVYDLYGLTEAEISLIENRRE